MTEDSEVQTIAAGPEFRSWEPRGIGLPSAALIALLLVAGVVGACVWAYEDFKPKPVPQAIQVTQATLTQLPRPTPPPPPKVVPPPKPIPAVIPKPPPVQSRIVVATKPPPRIHYTPVPHPVINHQPPPPTPVPVTPAPQPVAPPAPPTSGIPIYGSAIHDIVQSNQNVPPALAQLGLSGTVILSVTVAPDGHVISVRVITSSGIPLIDQTAIDHVKQASFPPFNDEMPGTPQTYTLPVEISAGDDSGN